MDPGGSRPVPAFTFNLSHSVFACLKWTPEGAPGKGCFTRKLEACVTLLHKKHGPSSDQTWVVPWASFLANCHTQYKFWFVLFMSIVRRRYITSNKQSRTHTHTHTQRTQSQSQSNPRSTSESPKKLESDKRCIGIRTQKHVSSTKG